MSGAATDKPLKILIATQFFDPEPTFKGLTFAKALKEQGHEVAVLTGFPNYPGGKLYAGYKLSLSQTEYMSSVKVTRVYLYPSHDSSKIGRSLNYISFFLSSLFYLLFFAPKCDVVYAYHPPATTGLSVAIAQIFRRTPTVLDIQDLWPDTLATTKMINNGMVLRLIGTVCSLIYKLADHIVVLSPGFKKELSKRGVPADRLTVIRNWADESPTVPCELPPEVTDKSKFKVLFSGNMGDAQGLETILEAARLLETTHPKVQILLLGSGVQTEKLKSTKDEMGLKNVLFLPRVPMSVVGNYMQAADCLLVHLKNDPLFEITIPSKTQAYLAAGKPILMAVGGDAANIVLEAQAGLTAKSGDALGIATGLGQLSEATSDELEHFGKSAKLYYSEYLSLNKGVAQFIEVFKSLSPQTTSQSAS